MTQLSYSHGASDVPLLGETIGVNFDRTVARWGDRPGLISCAQGIHWNYAQLGERVNKFAAGLLALGLEPGDRVGIWSPNNAEWIVTQFATAKAGFILVNINPAYRLSEVEYALNKVGCRALIAATRFKTSDYIGMVNTLAPELARSKPGHLESAKLPHLRIVIQIGESAPGTVAFEDVYGNGSPAEHARLKELATILQFDDPINPVHLRHDRAAEGCDADPSRHPQQRLLRRRDDALHRGR
jgi:fatty-acyl-CoA synthase